MWVKSQKKLARASRARQLSDSVDVFECSQLAACAIFDASCVVHASGTRSIEQRSPGRRAGGSVVKVFRLHFCTPLQEQRVVPIARVEIVQQIDPTRDTYELLCRHPLRVAEGAKIEVSVDINVDRTAIVSIDTSSGPVVRYQVNNLWVDTGKRDVNVANHADLRDT